MDVDRRRELLDTLLKQHIAVAKAAEMRLPRLPGHIRSCGKGPISGFGALGPPPRAAEAAACPLGHHRT